MQKTPVFLFLFGVLSSFEVLCTGLIRKCYNENEWETKTKCNLNGARNTFDKLKDKNEELELIDFIYLRVRLDVLLNTPIIRN